MRRRLRQSNQEQISKQSCKARTATHLFQAPVRDRSSHMRVGKELCCQSEGDLVCFIAIKLLFTGMAEVSIQKQCSPCTHSLRTAVAAGVRLQRTCIATEIGYV